MTTPSYMSGLLFTKAHRLVRARIYDILEQYNLNPTLWSMLNAATTAADGIRSSVVADLLGVKPPMVTLLADELISQGLIDRIAHHSDGRVKLLVPTTKGKKLTLEIEQKLSSEIGILMAGVSPSDAHVFQKVLETIIANAE